jgi:hypothetical protein
MHQKYEPDVPIHRAVNITRRALLDRVEVIGHDEYDLWRGRDPETGVESEHWRDDRQTAKEQVAHDVRMDMCWVNECLAYLGEGNGGGFCDEHAPDEYIECAVDGCEYPTHHSGTDHCSHHTWRRGREASEQKVATDGGQPGPGKEAVDGEVYEYPFRVVDFHGEIVREELDNVPPFLKSHEIDVLSKELEERFKDGIDDSLNEQLLVEILRKLPDSEYGRDALPAWIVRESDETELVTDGGQPRDFPSDAERIGEGWPNHPEAGHTRRDSRLKRHKDWQAGVLVGLACAALIGLLWRLLR